MNTRLQINPALAGALICATGWFSACLLAFHPAPIQPIHRITHPEFTRLIADNATLNKLKAPTLFALPSAEGFSGSFFQDHIALRPLTIPTNNPACYLQPGRTATPGIDLSLLTSETLLPQSPLPIPGATPRPVIRLPKKTQLFFAPELAKRAPVRHELDMSPDGLPGTLRVQLSVRPDGAVESAFFETPVSNSVLQRTVRQLQFQPSDQTTAGWMDIRFAQQGAD